MRPTTLRPSPASYAGHLLAALAALASLTVCAAVGPHALAARGPLAPARGPVAGRPGTVTIALDPTPARARLDRAVPVTGSVTDDAGRPLSGVTLVVEVGTSHGWTRTPGTALSDARGRFRLGAPTFFYGRHVYRVSAPALGGASAGRVLRVPTPYRPVGSPRAWRVAGTRFDPCAPIPYRVNLAGAPRNALDLIAATLRKARAATGLTFTYAGSYSGVPFGRSGDGLPASGLGFAWAAPAQVPALAGGVIGLGGGGWSSGSRRLSAGVVIDRTFRLRPGWRSANSVGGLLLHEVGHALGLEHVSDRHQQMYPRDVGTPTGDYNGGDLTALRRLGLEGGCLGAGPGGDTGAGRPVVREQPFRV